MNWHYVYFSRTPIITGLDFLTSDVAVSDHASEQISLLYFSIHTSDRTVHFTAKWNKMYMYFHIITTDWYDSMVYPSSNPLYWNVNHVFPPVAWSIRYIYYVDNWAVLLVWNCNGNPLTYGTFSNSGEAHSTTDSGPSKCNEPTPTKQVDQKNRSHFFRTSSFA